MNKLNYIEHYKYLKLTEIITKSKIEVLSKQLAICSNQDEAVKLDIEVRYNVSFLEKLGEIIADYSNNLINFANTFDEVEKEVFALLIIKNMSETDISKEIKMPLEDIKRLSEVFNISLKETKLF